MKKLSIDAFEFSFLQVPIEAAYAYDAVKLYAESAHAVVEAGGDYRNGSQITAAIVAKKEYYSDIQVGRNESYGASRVEKSE